MARGARDSTLFAVLTDSGQAAGSALISLDNENHGPRPTPASPGFKQPGRRSLWTAAPPLSEWNNRNAGDGARFPLRPQTLRTPRDSCLLAALRPVCCARPLVGGLLSSSFAVTVRMRTLRHVHQTHVSAPTRGAQRRRHRVSDGPRGAPLYLSAEEGEGVVRAPSASFGRLHVPATSENAALVRDP